MASLRAIRTRIRSVQSTQKITKAMKMVSASKLRRAQDAVVRARPYAQLIDQMLATRSPANVESEADQASHPLLVVRPPRRVEVVAMTSDRGMCGGFNTNIIRRAQRFLTEEGARFERIQFSTVGRRGRDYARKRNIPRRKDYVGFFGHLSYANAREIADDLIHAYVQDELDAVYLLYNEFKSAIQQQITLVQLLPLRPQAVAPEQKPGAKGMISPEHLFEPSRTEVLDAILPRYLAMQIWRALLESEASEHGARMTAMDSATKNATEMIDRLSLRYNRARQAAITKELMEIVSGAEAMK
jgi:F-type H+-transporting ATPase subunit gamma